MESHFLYNADSIGSHCHSATIVWHNNSLFASWYGYAEKETEKGQICIAKYDSVKKSWGKARLVFENLKNVSCGNPVIFSDPLTNRLHLYFVILKYHYWDSAQVYHTSSNDDGKTWKEHSRLMIDEGIMVRHRPEPYRSGSMLIPAYDEKNNTSIFYQSRDPFEKWEKFSEIHGDFIQADFFNYRNSEWQAFLRPAGESEKKVYRCLSADDAKTWGRPIETELSCPLSGIAARYIKDKTILICFNDTQEFKRNPISLAISEDYGLTFRRLKHLDQDNIELSYPSMELDGLGNVHLVYTFNRRMIKHVVIPISELVNE